MEKLVDVHAHLDDEQFEGEVAEIVSRAKANGIERIITNGTNVSSSKRAVEIAESFDEVLTRCIFDFILFGNFAIEGITNAYGDKIYANLENHVDNIITEYVFKM